MRSQEGPTVKEQLPPIQTDSQQRGEENVEREERKWIIHLCIQAVSSSMKCWCVLVPPLGASIYSALRGQMPPPPTVKLHANLEAYCCCFPHFYKKKKIPFA